MISYFCLAVPLDGVELCGSGAELGFWVMCSVAWRIREINKTDPNSACMPLYSVVSHA